MEKCRKIGEPFFEHTTSHAPGCVKVFMDSETIYNPDLQLGICRQENYAPVFSHFIVDFSGPLLSSENPIINKLLMLGFEVRSAVTHYYLGFPTGNFELSRHFKAQEREEFQICFTGGFLRFRFEGPDTAHLSLFRIDRERRGKGLARQHFPRVIDGLFRAGCKSVHGEVASSWYEAADSINIPKLTNFYVRHGFRRMGNNVISKSSPYSTAQGATLQSSP